MDPGPWQLGFAWPADANRATGLATKDAAWWQQEIQARIPPCRACAAGVFGLTVSCMLFILHAPATDAFLFRKMAGFCVVHIMHVVLANSGRDGNQHFARLFVGRLLRGVWAVTHFLERI